MRSTTAGRARLPEPSAASDVLRLTRSRRASTATQESTTRSAAGRRHASTREARASVAADLRASNPQRPPSRLLPQDDEPGMPSLPPVAEEATTGPGGVGDFGLWALGFGLWALGVGS